MAATLFWHERASEHITRIRTPFNVCAYLVEGERRAVLLDTGYGVGSLKAYVEGLTTLPYDVLLSHGHLDHVGGAGEFERAHLNERDWELGRAMSADVAGRRADVTRKSAGALPEGVREEDFIPPYTASFEPLDEGMVWDLGGVRVEALACPGHTAGSLIFLVQPDRVALFGDSCGEHTLLLFEEGSSVAAYAEALRRVQEREAEFDLVLRNHGTGESEKRILADNLALCQDILAGRDARVPVSIRGVQGFMGREDPHPGTCGNILYCPDRLR